MTEENTSLVSKKAIDLAEKNVVILGESTLVAEAAKEMRKKGVMSILVGDAEKKSCVGIVTEKDILYRVVAENRGPFKTTLKTIMSTPLITIDGNRSLKDAIELMRVNYIRRLPVTDEDGKVVGMLTLRSIVGNSLERALDLAEVEPPVGIPLSRITCPYCHSEFPSKDELSKHIDRLHLGSGLLEGDLRQW
ncbi:MAG TPA: CBS domain-containing protein [Nitrososphaera sp.]